jgi:ribosomal protein L37AE/L43A
MPLICRTLARAWHRVMLAYCLACAREEGHRRGLRVSSGIWFCAGCERVVWDLDTFVVHSRAHAG